MKTIRTVAEVVAVVAVSLFAAGMIAVLTLPGFGAWLGGGDSFAWILAIEGSYERVSLWLVLCVLEPTLAMTRRTPVLNKEAGGFLFFTGIMLGILNVVYVCVTWRAPVWSMVLAAFLQIFYFGFYWNLGNTPQQPSEEKKLAALPPGRVVPLRAVPDPPPDDAQEGA